MALWGKQAHHHDERKSGLRMRTLRISQENMPSPPFSIHFKRKIISSCLHPLYLLSNCTLSCERSSGLLGSPIVPSRFPNASPQASTVIRRPRENDLISHLSSMPSLDAGNCRYSEGTLYPARRDGVANLRGMFRVCMHARWSCDVII